MGEFERDVALLNSLDALRVEFFNDEKMLTVGTMAFFVFRLRFELMSFLVAIEDIDRVDELTAPILAASSLTIFTLRTPGFDTVVVVSVVDSLSDLLVAGAEHFRSSFLVVSFVRFKLLRLFVVAFVVFTLVPLVDATSAGGLFITLFV